MGTWSIIPSTASIDQNGNVTFPPNTDSIPKKYKIFYTMDDGSSCEKEVIQEGTGCIFGYVVNSNNIPGDREAEYRFGTITPNGADVSQIRVAVYDGGEYINGSLSINSNNQVVGIVKKNPSDGTRTISYRLETSNGSVCYDKTATQGSGCNCDNLNISTESLDWAWNVRTPKDVIITLDPCVTTFSTSSLNYFTTGLTDISTTEKKLTVTPNGDNESEEPYRDSLVISYLNNCTKTISLVQNINACVCGDLSVDKTSLTWDYGDSLPKDIIVTSSSCVTNISIPSSTEHYTITTTHTDTQDKIIVQPRNASLVSDDTFSITYLRDCDITISLKQNAQVFDCNDISVIDGALSNYRFTLKEFYIPGNVELGWVVAPLSITTSAEFKQHIPEDGLRAEDAVVAWDDWAGGRDGQPLRRCIVVKKINEVDSPRISNVYVTIDGHECAVFQFLRTCPCAMDNCYPNAIDEGSGKYDYPLTITSYPSSATTTVTDAYGNPFECNCSAYTSDYICLDDVTNLYYVDENDNEHQVWGSGGLYEDAAGFVPNVPGYEYNGFNETTSQGLQMFYYEAGHQIFYVCPPNLTYVRKDYTVKFRVKNDARISCNDKYGWYGEKACEEFIVHLYQAPCGGSYEHHYRDEQGIDHKICTAKDPYTGENNRVLVRKRTGINPYEGNLIPCPFLPMDNQPVWCDENHVCEEKPWQQRVDNTGTCVPT